MSVPTEFGHSIWFFLTLPAIVLYGGHLSTLGRTETEWRMVCLDVTCQITSGRLGVRSQSWSYLSVTVWRRAGPHPHPRDGNPCPVVRRQIKPHPSVDTCRMSYGLLYQTDRSEDSTSASRSSCLGLFNNNDQQNVPLCYMNDISDTMGGNFVYFFSANKNSSKTEAGILGFFGVKTDERSDVSCCFGMQLVQWN